MNKALQFIIYSYCLLFIFPRLSMAQDRMLKGTIKGKKGQTIPAASVIQKGTNKAATTNLDGNFTITLGGTNPEIMISTIGYATKVIKIGAENVLTILLQESSSMLNDVVVVGYGMQKKSSITGAISSIGNKNFINQPVSNLAQSIQGNKFGEGITTDLGGEFVDTTHLDIIQLAKEFNVDFYDLRKNEITEGAFYFEGKYYTNEDLKNAILPFVTQIEKDVKSLPEKINYTTGDIFKHLDEQSVSKYLTNIGVTGWLYNFLSLVITREYGMEASEQSAINFLIMFTQLGPNGYELFGVEHEVLKIKGGSQYLTNKLHNHIKNQVRLNYTLTNISQSNTNKYNLVFKNKASVQHIEADYVILAIPFSILRNIPLRVKMPPEKLNCIYNLGYGNSSKFIMGFKDKPWCKTNKTGQTYTNLFFGCTWDSS